MEEVKQVVDHVERKKRRKQACLDAQVVVDNLWPGKFRVQVLGNKLVVKEVRSRVL